MNQIKKYFYHFDLLSFDPLSFDPVSFDPVSFDHLSVNQLYVFIKDLLFVTNPVLIYKSEGLNTRPIHFSGQQPASLVKQRVRLKQRKTRVY